MEKETMRTKQLILLGVMASLVAATHHNLVSARSTRTSAPGSGRLAAAAFEIANEVFLNAEDVAYEHPLKPASRQVVRIDGRLAARTDCSGFMSYVLNKAAPAPQYAAVMDLARREYQEDQERKGRTPRDDRPFYPDAKEYADFFATLSTRTPSDGWIGVQSVWDLRRGDLIAWAKESWDGKGNSGHVAMVMDPPSRQLVEAIAVERNREGVSHEVRIKCVNIRVLDSSSVSHFGDEQLPPIVAPRQQQRDGVGTGYIRLVLDSGGMPIRYWEGYYWGEGQKDIKTPGRSSNIHFGRLVD
jgi:cell wall-associated NlpC family hydrolase